MLTKRSSHNGRRSFTILLLLVVLSLLVAVALAGKDYYKILGVDRSASKKEIKKKYKDLSKKYHPDKNPGDKDAENKFIELAEGACVCVCLRESVSVVFVINQRNREKR